MINAFGGIKVENGGLDLASTLDKIPGKLTWMEMKIAQPWLKKTKEIIGAKTID